MGVKVTASGTLIEPPRPWKDALVLELDCPTKTSPPKGLPEPAAATVTVFCSPKAWRGVQAEAATGRRLIAEGELCLDVPQSVVRGEMSMVALRLTAVPLPVAPRPTAPGAVAADAGLGHAAPVAPAPAVAQPAAAPATGAGAGGDRGAPAGARAGAPPWGGRDAPAPGADPRLAPARP